MITHGWARVCVCVVAVLAGGCRSTPITQVFENAPDEPDEIVVVLTGNENVKSQDLRAIVLDELDDLKGARPSKAFVDDAAFALELYYLAHGFPDVRVTYVFDDAPDDPVAARFQIEEGRAVRIAKVSVTGADAIDRDTTKEIFKDQKKGDAFVRTAIDLQVRALRDRYLDLGYLRATTEVAVRFEDDRAWIDVTVHEGPQFSVTEVKYVGGLEECAEGQEALAQRFVGRTYTPSAAYELRSLLVSEYANRGYADCTVGMDVALEEETGNVEFHYNLVPGPVVGIGAIRVAGNDRTLSGVITGRLHLSAGDRYDAGLARKGVRDLYATGLFESIHIKLEPSLQVLPGENATRDLVVTVVELPSREVRFEPGYGSYEGPRVAVALEERNLFGTARRASLTASLSARSKGARLALSDTQFLGSPMTLSLSVFTDEREEPSYEVQQFGTDLILSRRWHERFLSTVGYEYSLNDLIDIDGVVTSAEAVESPDVGAITTSLTYEGRDNVLLPTRGTRVRARLEWDDVAFGSELEALRFHFDVSHIFPLGDRTGVAATLRTGIISPIGDTDVIPIYERVFNGGENSVRSFREDELGPKDATGEATGGEASSLLSLEMRQVIDGHLSWALFADAGNVQPLIDDYFQFNDFRYAVGIGLRYSLPIGPVRLDFGVNPNARDGEDDFVLHFSVGYPY